MIWFDSRSHYQNPILRSERARRNVVLFLTQIDSESDILSSMLRVQEGIAPKHTSHQQMHNTRGSADEDLLTMVHELSQVCLPVLLNQNNIAAIS